MIRAARQQGVHQEQEMAQEQSWLERLTQATNTRVLSVADFYSGLALARFAFCLSPTRGIPTR